MRHSTDSDIALSDSFLRSQISYIDTKLLSPLFHDNSNLILYYFFYLLLIYFTLSGTIITVANVGDSRVILGYQKDVSPPSGSYPRPLTRASIISPDSPETSHEEISLHDKQTVNAASLLDDKVRAARKASSNVVGASTKEYDNAVDLEGVEDNRLWGHITTMPLSTDHKPDDPKEAAVIIAAGTLLHPTLHCPI